MNLILIKMNREDKAAVFLRKNFDCIKSQALLKEIEEGKGCPQSNEKDLLIENEKVVQT